MSYTKGRRGVAIVLFILICFVHSSLVIFGQISALENVWQGFYEFFPKLVLQSFSQRLLLAFWQALK